MAIIDQKMPGIEAGGANQAIEDGQRAGDQIGIGEPGSEGGSKSGKRKGKKGKNPPCIII